MSVENFLGLLGGLALFLYGMQMMSNGLEAAAGNRMKQILEKLTANRFLGVAVGAGITAVIQSSSATTVMVVGFVNSGMMTLKQAVWIIMGANIGTTITGQLIAMDVGMMAPLFAFIGVAMVVFLKSPKVHHFGQILAGLGVLFIGMDMMGAAMIPLRESEAFISLMTKFSNPLLGILGGAVFTALIQSSSASVGILQALASNGLISFPNAVFVLFGQNIGTCITAVLAAIGTSRNAKRTTIIHLMFNVIGTTVFTIVCLTFSLTDLVASVTPGNPASQIANMHTLFNIVTTAMLLPFGEYLAKAAVHILPDPKKAEKDMATALKEDSPLGNVKLGFSAIQLTQLKQEIRRMLKLARENVNRGFQAVLDRDNAVMEKSYETEQTIDLLNKEIGQYISKVLVHNKTGNVIEAIEQYFLITGNIERIGDYAINIANYVQMMEKNDILFSKSAKEEILNMQKICDEAMELLLHREDEVTKWVSKVAAMEQQIDDMVDTYRDNHLERMRQGKCTEEGFVLFSELLIDFGRIGDHILHIAQEYAKIIIVS
ncbi:MAG: Na/Pi cotransporter family protein [Lachnospiraceae bacterium]|nr:Na/Pi cotransporter family protein [Lachnospiraceae bacterium]